VLRPDGRFLYADFRPREEVAGWRASLVAAGFAIEVERDLRPGVVAALDADDDRKRDLIARLVDRPLAHIFREFAAIRGSALSHDSSHLGATGQRVRERERVRVRVRGWLGAGGSRVRRAWGLTSLS
jgi:hypothetical protein